MRAKLTKCTIFMAIPKFEDFLYPFMQHLVEKDSNKGDMVSYLADHFNVSVEEQRIKTDGGSTFQFYDRVGWSLQWLRRALFVEIPERGVWKITERGRQYMMSHKDLRESDLLGYPEFADYSGTKTSKKQIEAPKYNVTPQEFNMEQNDNWLEIVETIKPCMDTQSSYSTFYNTVVTCFRLLGWKKSKGSLITFYPSDSDVKEGLIFLNVESLNFRVPIVPLDCHNSYTEESRVAVLFKAMEEWDCIIGLLFTDAIQLFYKNKNEMDTPVCISTIQFDEKDIYGYILCNLLTFNGFSLRRLEQFCQKEFDKIPSSSNILKRIHEISSNSEYIAYVLKEYLLAEGYEEETIDSTLEKFIFRIKFNEPNSERVKPINQDRSQSSRDTAKFSIDGGATFYNKRRFVLQVIRQYIMDHPSVSYDDLEQRFPSEIISKVRGVVRPWTVVQEWIRENPDVASRYFTAPDEIITLQDGMQIVVHNQWGSHFPDFLSIAKELYEVKSNRHYDGVDEIIDEVNDSVPEDKFGIKISPDSFSRFRSNK